MKYLKSFRKRILESNSDKRYAYHVTDRKNLKSIMKNGLEPRVSQDYGEDGDIKGVYLFKTLDDTHNALLNWLGIRIEEWEEETGEEYDDVVLKIDITGLEATLLDTVEFEWTSIENIDPSRIVDVFEM